MILKRYIQENTNDNPYYIDPKTGELFQSNSNVVYIQTQEERLRAKQNYNNKRIKEQQSSILHEKYKKYGTFIWNIYNLTQQTELPLKASNITRIMFLSTYINYNGTLMFTQRESMNKKDMQKILKLSNGEFCYFYNEMIKNKIFIIKDDKYYLNYNLFKKGSISKSKIMNLIQQDKYITRLYVDGVRTLYNKSTSRSHKTLSYLFQIMPYVNRQYNIVCKNPLEDNLDDIQCMSLGEFCDVINYNKHNVRQLRRMLFDPKFEFKNKITSAIRLVSDDSNTLHDKIFINPCIYYAGDKWEEVEVLGKF